MRRILEVINHWVFRFVENTEVVNYRVFEGVETTGGCHLWGVRRCGDYWRLVTIRCLEVWRLLKVCNYKVLGGVNTTGG